MKPNVIQYKKNKIKYFSAPNPITCFYEIPYSIVQKLWDTVATKYPIVRIASDTTFTALFLSHTHQVLGFIFFVTMQITVK